MQSGQVVNVIEKTSADCEQAFALDRASHVLTDACCAAQGGHARTGTGPGVWSLQIT